MMPWRWVVAVVIVVSVLAAGFTAAWLSTHRTEPQKICWQVADGLNYSSAGPCPPDDRLIG